MTEERRNHKRLPLRLPLLLLGADSFQPIRGATANISNQGLYCKVSQPFPPGKSLKCLISLAPQPVREQFYLEAHIEVIRLVVDKESEFGIGCKIHTFRMVSGSADPLWTLQGESIKNVPS